MKLFTTLSTAALVLAGIAAEVHAIPYVADTQTLTAPQFSDDATTWTEARRGRGGDDGAGDDRGRGRGRGGDRSRSDDAPGSRSDDSRGRSRPRIRGGSGCDDAGDQLEHPECGMLIDNNGNGIDDRLENGSGSRDDTPSGSGRKRPRVPGGSGCDDPGDILEHPECSA